MSFVYPYFINLLNTGQVSIPVGTKSFTIQCISGSVNVGPSGGLLVAPSVISMNMPDSKFILGQAINVNCTGVGNRTMVFWAQ